MGKRPLGLNSETLLGFSCLVFMWVSGFLCFAEFVILECLGVFLKVGSSEFLLSVAKSKNTGRMLEMRQVAIVSKIQMILNQCALLQGLHRFTY